MWLVIALTASAPLVAGSASAQLTIGVVVARACQIDAQPATETSSRVRFACAAGAARSLRTNDATRIGGSRRSPELLSQTVPWAESQSDWRVVIVNF